MPVFSGCIVRDILPCYPGDRTVRGISESNRFGALFPVEKRPPDAGDSLEDRQDACDQKYDKHKLETAAQDDAADGAVPEDTEQNTGNNIADFFFCRPDHTFHKSELLSVIHTISFMVLQCGNKIKNIENNGSGSVRVV